MRRWPVIIVGIVSVGAAMAAGKQPSCFIAAIPYDGVMPGGLQSVVQYSDAIACHAVHHHPDVILFRQRITDTRCWIEGVGVVLSKLIFFR